MDRELETYVLILPQHKLLKWWYENNNVNNYVEIDMN